MWWTAVFEPVWAVSLLPSNATVWERALEAVDSDLVARDPVGLIFSSRSVTEVPVEWLPYLAEERSVDEFSSAWPESRRRAATAGSFPLHQVKGTRPALARALGSVGYDAHVQEWFEVIPNRQANTFRVSVTVGADREWVGGRAEVIRVANKAKNAHTKLEQINVNRQAVPAMAFVGAIQRRVRTLLIKQQPNIDTIHMSTMVWVGAAQMRNRTLIIGPRP